MALIVLDRQHTGKPRRPADTGAWSPIAEESEAYLVARYLLELEFTLRELGHTVMPISLGEYKDRHLRVNRLFARFPKSCVYLAGHLNAGGGDYSAVFYDHRSVMGEELAATISEHLAEVVPGAARHIASRPDDWTENAFSTIRGLFSGRGCGVCLEPFFLDASTHSDLTTPEGLESVAKAIAIGVDVWTKTTKRG